MTIEINALERSLIWRGGEYYRPVTLILDTVMNTLTIVGLWGKTYALVEVTDEAAENTQPTKEDE
ncbi:hypothetical protein [Zavarzinella formosa]|uniref:hypothetical protein n=1 Tax=Zavarzinella formosa TaxID=360055 RepID=UPI0002DA48A2|nr:hypothetical protein [Zavarzinella formosa]